KHPTSATKSSLQSQARQPLAPRIAHRRAEKAQPSSTIQHPASAPKSPLQGQAPRIAPRRAEEAQPSSAIQHPARAPKSPFTPPYRTGLGDSSDPNGLMIRISLGSNTSAPCSAASFATPVNSPE